MILPQMAQDDFLMLLPALLFCDLMKRTLVARLGYNSDAKVDLAHMVSGKDLWNGLSPRHKWHPPFGLYRYHCAQYRPSCPSLVSLKTIFGESCQMETPFHAGQWESECKTLLTRG